MNSWKAKAPPAWEPPFKTFWNGTGKTYGAGVSDNSAKCWYNGTFFSAAAALATANETPKIALAPNLALFGVPSNFNKKSSTACWFLTSKFSLIKAGAITSLTLATALVTPLPNHFDLSPSLNSKASWIPVEAPDGTIDLNKPFSVVISTSTVGLPLES
ncbi:hypothetical protein WICMUC_003144 [Wickerhamomyces mucosus]|uniref:Uncharacterized protein n=1 Tax=Wickerhamomyces mucosus TaxID=1378264 RepID=A0A9P8TCN7_9ASCO|nr:hypothetical protein WICMUC_003144 [Wickerhamomyces mucosus]